MDPNDKCSPVIQRNTAKKKAQTLKNKKEKEKKTAEVNIL